ncbi:MFS transporter [Streptomyces sp. NBC_01754]|uniref:MFS transporter n=1 Tax=Streptomyces sp. NBC_01754 TaxID=2975930 RepID=UPI002DD94E49|nr:MFS transporter [Streptomyces sp. NBC_01754]WSC90913.1 MFS transporter [Streptomyces sp. NBC_01754]WSC96593.1 MFS transporter [Streptomyces sp. NBC_01754]
MTGTDVAPPSAGRRHWWALVVLALPTFMAAMDITALFLALPHISADLHTSSTQELWITDVYGFLIAGFLVTMGTLGDRVGRRKVLLIGATAFGILSVVAAFSTSPEMLIIVRALLGVAGATIMPSTLAFIMTMFQDPKQMSRAIGVWATSMLAGIAVGPAIGGLLLGFFWWGSVFLVAVPVMVTLLIAGPKLLPDIKNPMAGKLDLLSVLLSLLAILPVIYGLKETVSHGWAALPVAAAVIGLLCGIAFVVRQRRLENPLLDLSLFGIRTVSGGLVLGLLFAMIQGGMGLLVTQFLQIVGGYSALDTALWLLIPAGVMVIGIQLVTPISQKLRPGVVLVTGLIIASVGMFLLTQVEVVGGTTMLILGNSIIYLGGSPIGVLVNQVVMGAAPPERMGSAASLQSTGGELGVALGIATVGTIATGFYTNSLSLPDDVPAKAADAAQESIASAAATAGDQSPEVASGILSAAQEAFTSALNSTAAVCTVAFLALAVLAYTTIRHVPILAPPPAPPADDAGETADEGAVHS